jgi:hypothetical protein
MRLGLGTLARLLIAELAIVHELADRRPLVGSHLDEVGLGLAGHLQRLAGGHHPQLFSLTADEANGTNADLLVDP